MKANVNNRTIFIGDNLDFLIHINSECVDLICTDPPFNKKKEFTATAGSAAEGARFLDRFAEHDVKKAWADKIRREHFALHSLLAGIKAMGNHYNYCYLIYMAMRIIECRRILKTTGSFYLHCDPTMSHYLKLLLDCIFGEKNFRNEIIWKRSSGKSSQHAPRSYARNSDTLLFYSKTDQYKILPFVELDAQTVKTKFPHVAKDGRRYAVRGLFRGQTLGARPNLCYAWRGYRNPYSSGWALSKTRLEQEYQKGNIVILPTGKLQRRQYLQDSKGGYVGNIWTDIPIAAGGERTGWPTQKPLALYERIIQASSNKGDMVLDPFCGCATTCIAAEKLRRQWVGMDVAMESWRQVQSRLKKETPVDASRGAAILLRDPPTRD